MEEYTTYQKQWACLSCEGWLHEKPKASKFDYIVLLKVGLTDKAWVNRRISS